MIACEITIDTYPYVEDGVVHVDIDTSVTVEGRLIPIAGEITTVPMPRHPPSEIEEREEEVFYGIVTEEGVKIIFSNGDSRLLHETIAFYRRRIIDRDLKRPKRDLTKGGES